MWFELANVLASSRWRQTGRIAPRSVVERQHVGGSYRNLTTHKWQIKPLSPLLWCGVGRIRDVAAHDRSVRALPPCAGQQLVPALIASLRGRNARISAGAQSPRVHTAR